jgi:hypothetical protein
VMKGFHMLATPAAWLTNPAVVARVLMVWLTPKRAKLALYPPKLGPARREMFTQLGLDPTVA